MMTRMLCCPLDAGHRLQHSLVLVPVGDAPGEFEKSAALALFHLDMNRALTGWRASCIVCCAEFVENLTSRASDICNAALARGSAAQNAQPAGSSRSSTGLAAPNCASRDVCALSFAWRVRRGQPRLGGAGSQRLLTLEGEQLTVSLPTAITAHAAASPTAFPAAPTLRARTRSDSVRSLRGLVRVQVAHRVVFHSLAAVDSVRRRPARALK